MSTGINGVNLAHHITWANLVPRDGAAPSQWKGPGNEVALERVWWRIIFVVFFVSTQILALSYTVATYSYRISSVISTEFGSYPEVISNCWRCLKYNRTSLFIKRLINLNTRDHFMAVKSKFIPHLRGSLWLDSFRLSNSSEIRSTWGKSKAVYTCHYNGFKLWLKIMFFIRTGNCFLFSSGSIVEHSVFSGTESFLKDNLMHDQTVAGGRKFNDPASSAISSNNILGHCALLVSLMLRCGTKSNLLGKLIGHFFFLSYSSNRKP